MLEDGQVIEQGTHDDLIRQDGSYARMFKLQAEKYRQHAEKYTVEWHYNGFDYVFHTLDSLFSYKQVDIGTQRMIEYIDQQPDSKVLDFNYS